MNFFVLIVLLAAAFGAGYGLRHYISLQRHKRARELADSQARRVL